MREFDLEPDELTELFVLVSEGDEAEAVPTRLDGQPRDACLELLRRAFRPCFISQGALERQVEDGHVLADVVAAVVPTRPSIMSGDTGEILAALSHAIIDHDELVVVKKWRLKADRDSAAPRVDLVMLDTPDWPQWSSRDRLICAEVKTKATDTDADPIGDAIADAQKDPELRAAKTVAWLKRLSLAGRLESPSFDQLERFVRGLEFPTAPLVMRAIAVICAGLVEAEIEKPRPAPFPVPLVVLSVPDLRELYTELLAGLGEMEL